jgi:hydrogenase maturation protease
MTPQTKLLVAGIGNIFLGDDAFGCEVVQQLLKRAWPAEVRIVDYGIRGLDLAYAMLENYATVIFIDATPQGGTPGTLYTMELHLADAGAPSATLDPHSMHPLNVLRLVQTLGGTGARILLVGCEPADLGEEGGGKMGLSEPVQAAVYSAIPRIEALIAEFLENRETSIKP